METPLAAPMQEQIHPRRAAIFVVRSRWMPSEMAAALEPALSAIAPGAGSTGVRA